MVWAQSSRAPHGKADPKHCSPDKQATHPQMALLGRVPEAKCRIQGQAEGQLWHQVPSGPGLVCYSRQHWCVDNNSRDPWQQGLAPSQFMARLQGRLGHRDRTMWRFHQEIYCVTEATFVWSHRYPQGNQSQLIQPLQLHPDSAPTIAPDTSDSSSPSPLIALQEATPCRIATRSQAGMPDYLWYWEREMWNTGLNEL